MCERAGAMETGPEPLQQRGQSSASDLIGQLR